MEHAGDRQGPAGVTRAAVFALFLLVPVCVAEALTARFTGPRWYLLQLLGVAWFLGELWTVPRPRWPAFLRRRVPRLAAVLLLCTIVAGAFRHGLASAAPVLLDRAGFLLLALAAYWHVTAHGWPAREVGLATRLGLGGNVVVGLAQVLGLQPLEVLAAAGDKRSAFFGNANLAAQYLGIAVVVLVARPGPRAGARRLIDDALLAAALVYLYFLSCRSVFLGLPVALLALVAVRAVTARRVAGLLAAAAIGVGLVLFLGGAGILHPLDPAMEAEKSESVGWRMAVLEGTVALIEDHPWGVGSGRFGDAFLPYQLGLLTLPREYILFETPHDEYLRLIAEQGWAGAAAAAVLLLLLLLRLRSAWAWAAPVERALLAGGAAFLAVEAALQFPFATAAGCLMAAVLLGLALAVVEGSPQADARTPARGGRLAWRGLGSILALLGLVVLARVVASDWLYAQRRGDVASLSRACALDPRNLSACVTAAWHEARAGAPCRGRARLLEVLQRSPHYFPAIRLLGEEAFARGDATEGCLCFWIYDDLMRGTSSLHSRKGELCGSGRPRALPPGFTMPHYDSFPVVTTCGELR